MLPFVQESYVDNLWRWLLVGRNERRIGGVDLFASRSNLDVVTKVLERLLASWTF
jgi:hypothetical protein